MNLQQIKNNVDFSRSAYQTIGTYKGHGTGYAKVNDSLCILFDFNDEDIDEAQECQEYKTKLISDLCNFCAPKTTQFASLIPFMSEQEYTSIFDKFQSYYMAKANETVNRLFDEENGYIRSENGRKYLFTFISDNFID